MQEYIKKLLDIGKKKTYSEGSIIFFEGELPKSLLVLLNGKVRLHKLAKDSQTTLHTLSGTCFLAEMPSLTNTPYPATASAIKECEILQINLSTLNAHIMQDGEFALSLINSLCQKIGILERLLKQNSENIEERLANYLLNNKAALHTLSQRKIANDINTTPQSLSRILKSLKENKIIATSKGKIEIIDIARLSRF